MTDVSYTYIIEWVDLHEKRQKAAKRKRDLKDRAVAFLGGRCQICSYELCTAALEFHHLDPACKEFSISNKLTSWKKIEAELRECVLICCRCHREVHAGFHPGFLAFPDKDRSIY